MAEFTDRDMQDIERAENNDSVLLLKEIKSLREELREIKSGVVKEKTDEERKAEIMSIKDEHKRIKAIRDNLDVFQRLDDKARAEREEEARRRLGGRI